MFSKYTDTQLSVASRKLNISFPYIHNSFFDIETFWLRFSFGKNTAWNLREHHHSFYELHIALSGKATYHINSKEIILTDGTFLLIPPNVNHQIVDISDDFVKFAFSFELHNNDSFRSLLIRKIGTHFFDTTPPFAYTLVENILTNILNEEIGYRAMIENNIVNLLLALFQKKFKFSYCTKQEVSTDSYLDMRVKTALLYIDDNITDVTAVSIANHLHISVRQLSRTLKTALSMTTQEVIVSRRIKKAKKLMQNLDISLSEVAESSGFNSLQHFSKTFRKIEGTTATYYRRQISE